MKRLTLKSPHFLFLQKDFARWLDVLGYSRGMVSSFPLFLREFFHWLEAQGASQITQIDASLIQTYYLYLSRREKQRMGKGALATATVNHHLTALNKLADYLKKNADYILPVHGITPMEVIHQPIIPLTIAQIKALYHATKRYENDWPLQALRDRAMLALLYDCGLRRMEAVQLELPDLHLEDRTLLVRKGKNNKQRMVPFSQPTAVHLIDYCYLARPQLLDHQKNQALLLNLRGQPCSLALPGKRLKVIQQHVNDRELQGKSLHPHLLRHSIATHLLYGGMSLEHVSRFLGHGTLDVTQRYTHLVQEYGQQLTSP
ncbi:MAG: tyrosine-type recombinase/integrase [Verrucomicrobiota bacterium]